MAFENGTDCISDGVVKEESTYLTRFEEVGAFGHRVLLFSSTDIAE
jgi:hypothetical protein